MKIIDSPPKTPLIPVDNVYKDINKGWKILKTKNKKQYYYGCYEELITANTIAVILANMNWPVELSYQAFTGKRGSYSLCMRRRFQI